MSSGDWDQAGPTVTASALKSVLGVSGHTLGDISARAGLGHGRPNARRYEPDHVLVVVAVLELRPLGFTVEEAARAAGTILATRAQAGFVVVPGPGSRHAHTAVVAADALSTACASQPVPSVVMHLPTLLSSAGEVFAAAAGPG